ncbi:RNA polymerase sigma factor [Inquilinus sp. CA228]|uniref:RNA polymerase sigma factor n=1 Tax=Inquilinus sp. CA228 TaxID=3455609 RepID=UPI003F8D0460
MTWDLHGLFDRHAREIQRFLRRRGHTAETAADLTQDTFARLLTATPKGDNPRAYLHQVARNLSIDFDRRERRMGCAAISDEQAATIADPAPWPETIVHDRQKLAIVDRALAELPARTRRAFEAHRLGEKTLSEIGEELGLSTTRTWTLIREAYRHLRDRLGTIDG